MVKRCQSNRWKLELKRLTVRISCSAARLKTTQLNDSPCWSLVAGSTVTVSTNWLTTISKMLLANISFRMPLNWSGSGRLANRLFKTSWEIQLNTLQRSSHTTTRSCLCGFASSTDKWSISVCSWMPFMQSKKSFCSRDKHSSVEALPMILDYNTPEKI